MGMSHTFGATFRTKGPFSLMKNFLWLSLFTLTACEWTGRTFTTSVVVPVKTTAQSPSCTTSRVPVNLEEQKTFKEIQGLIGRLRIESISILVSEPETPQPDAQARSLRGRVSFVSAQTSVGAPVVEFNETELFSTFAAQTEGSTEDPIENLITLPSAVAAGEVALEGKGRFLLEVASCTDVNPADVELVTDLTFYLEL